jgi:hypothetical protein
MRILFSSTNFPIIGKIKILYWKFKEMMGPNLVVSKTLFSWVRHIFCRATKEVDKANIIEVVKMKPFFPSFVDVLGIEKLMEEITK